MVRRTPQDAVRQRPAHKESEGAGAAGGRPPREGPAADPQSPDIAALPFEEALTQLERVVEELEEGSLPLEEALARFERGIQLSRQLEKQLKEAEARVHRLVGTAEASPAPAAIERPGGDVVEGTVLYEAEIDAVEDSDEDEAEDEDDGGRDRLF